MIGYPLDSHVTYDEDGIPVFDRAITSAPLRQLLRKLFSDGVMPNPSNNLQVSAGTGMNVIVNSGFAMVNGCMKLEETQRTLVVQASDTTYDRIDTVVMRLNDNDNARYCDLYVIEGLPALSPVRPELTRNGSVWEIGLADIFIPKSSAAISNQRITDTRYETSRCGVISSISRFDTTTIYQQVQSDLAEFKESEQAEFMEWFTNLQSQLDENTATNLQNQIGTLSLLKTEIRTSLVNALNWIVDKIGRTDISGIGDGTLTGAIDNLNSSLESVGLSLSSVLEKTTGTITARTGWSVSGSRIEKRNGIVCLNLLINATNIINSGEFSVGIISSGYRPLNVIYASGTGHYNGGKREAVNITIKTNGEILLELGSQVLETGINWAMCNVSYLV